MTVCPSVNQGDEVTLPPFPPPLIIYSGAIFFFFQSCLGPSGPGWSLQIIWFNTLEGNDESLLAATFPPDKRQDLEELLLRRH